MSFMLSRAASTVSERPFLRSFATMLSVVFTRPSIWCMGFLAYSTLNSLFSISNFSDNCFTAES